MNMTVNPRQAPALDPITVEVLRNKLDGIAEEMQITLIRSSFSPFVKEGLDASASLFTIEGETLSQAVAIPFHLAAMIPMVRAVMEAFPLSTMAEGDLYVMNEPYGGGTHLPDILVMAPVFFSGRPIALSAAMTHHQDLGGMAPGSLPTNATDIFQEGLRIPPMKLRSAGVLDEPLLQLLRLNVRTPDMLMGDLNAQIAACNIGARGVGTLAAVHGAGTMLAVFKELLDRSELLTRQALLDLPQGSWSYTDYLDNDGVELDKPIAISVTVTIADGNFTCDFSESAPQVRGPFNCVPSGALAAACFAIRVIGDVSTPTNGGCFRPIRIVTKPGTIMNPVEPAPVNARSATIKRAVGSVLSALRSVIPDRISAADPAGTILMVAMGGVRDNGSRYVVGQAIAGGSGAHVDRDGIDVIETDTSNTMNLPVEALEMDAPILCRTRSLRRDSGGAGTFRGGLGVRNVFEVLEGELTLTHRGERHVHTARGSGGGLHGAPAFSSILRSDGSEEVIRSKIVTRMAKGDVLTVETPGGGGFGDPCKRAPERIRLDVADGKVSAEAAATIYGLAAK